MTNSTETAGESAPSPLRRTETPASAVRETHDHAAMTGDIPRHPDMELAADYGTAHPILPT